MQVDDGSRGALDTDPHCNTNGWSRILGLPDGLKCGPKFGGTHSESLKTPCGMWDQIVGLKRSSLSKPNSARNTGHMPALASAGYDLRSAVQVFSDTPHTCSYVRYQPEHPPAGSWSCPCKANSADLLDNVYVPSMSGACGHVWDSRTWRCFHGTNIYSRVLNASLEKCSTSHVLWTHTRIFFLWHPVSWELNANADGLGRQPQHWPPRPAVC